MHRYTFQPWPRTWENFRIPTVILPRRKENPSFEERFRVIGNRGFFLEGIAFFRSLEWVFFFLETIESWNWNIDQEEDQIEEKVVGFKLLVERKKGKVNIERKIRIIRSIFCGIFLINCEMNEELKRYIGGKDWFRQREELEINIFFSALTQVCSCEHLSRALHANVLFILRDSSYRLDRS